VRGISYWTKNYRTGIERADAGALERRYAYYDPIHTLPAEGRQWWAEQLSRVLEPVG
jgi:lysine 2,3-aminomutase